MALPSTATLAAPSPSAGNEEEEGVAEAGRLPLMLRSLASVRRKAALGEEEELAIPFARRPTGLLGWQVARRGWRREELEGGERREAKVDQKGSLGSLWKRRSAALRQPVASSKELLTSHGLPKQKVVAES